MQHLDFPEERAAFDRLREERLGDLEGKYVVLQGRRLLGASDDLDGAIELGLDRVGGPGFFCERLTRRPEVDYVPFLGAVVGP